METMDDRRGVFIDTNILIYASIGGSPFYQSAQDAIRRLEEENAELFIKAVRHFEEDFTVFNDDLGVTEQLLELAETVSVSGKQIHDANIVATMLVNDVHELLAHNVSDFKRFSSQIEIIPLII